MDLSKILSREEVLAVLEELKTPCKRSKRVSVQGQLRLTIFRLSCCCGLRRKEIRGLDMGDFIFTGTRPRLRVRKAITKGQVKKRKTRIVPLWWDEGTRADLQAWHDHRLAMGAKKGDPFVCAMRLGYIGDRLALNAVARAWRTAIRVLGPDRQSQLHVHCGRHTFISHALHIGHSLTEVREAAGHSSVGTTSGYLHLIERDGVPDLFASPPAT
jgi:integrase